VRSVKKPKTNLNNSFMRGSSFHELRSNKKIPRWMKNLIVKFTLLSLFFILGAIAITSFFVEPKLTTIEKKFDLSSRMTHGLFCISCLVSFAWLESLFFSLPTLIKDYLKLRKKDDFTFRKFFVSRYQYISRVLFSVISFLLIFLNTAFYY